MSLAYDILYAQKCRSTHHKIAMDALLKLRTDDRQRWIDLFIYYIDWYLDGAKAPDTKFKDFRNHVLHVNENYWGGACQAAQTWYDKTVDLFRRRDWPAAVYSAGVLSHYFTDPFQPFHTGQSEAEGVVHRAEEWSICKSYDSLRRLIEGTLGYPEWEIPEGDDWLAQMIRRGAEQGHEHYEICIDHYNIDLGSRNPPAGLDDEIRERIASQIALATVGFARVLERIIVGGGATADTVPVILTLGLSTLNMPVQAVRDFVTERGERIRVAEMYAEFKANGKVVNTLPEDDRAIRKAYAAEVLQVPVAALDAEKIRSPGSKHNTYEPRVPAAKKQTQYGRRRYNIHGQPIDEQGEIFRRVDPPATKSLAKAVIMPRATATVAPRRQLVSAISKTKSFESEDIENGATTATLSEPKAELHEKLETNQPTARKLADLREGIDSNKSATLFDHGGRGSKGSGGSLPLAASELSRTKAAIGSSPFVPQKPTRVDVAPNPITLDGPLAKKETVNEVVKAEAARAAAVLEKILQPEVKESAKSEIKDPLTPAAESKIASLLGRPMVPAESAKAPAATSTAAVPAAPTPKIESPPSPASPLSAAARSRRFKHYLELDDDLEAAPSIGNKSAARFTKIGIRSVREFLQADPEELADKLDLRHMPAALLRDWQTQARLNVAIPNLRGHDAQILVGCGLQEAKEVASATAETLYDFVKEYVSSTEGQRVLRGSQPPDLAEVKEWIEWAQDARPIAL